MQIEKYYTPLDLYDYMAFTGFFPSLPEGYKIIENDMEPARLIWMNKEKKTFITYCEHDITIETCSSEAEFKQELENKRKFYKKLLI